MAHQRAGSPALTAASAQPCATVGEYITEIVLKELYAVQIRNHQLAGELPRAFDPQPVRALLARSAPTLARDVVETVGGWVPAAGEVSADSLLPDLDQFPSAPRDAEGLSVQQRKLIFEACEILLDGLGARAESPSTPRTPGGQAAGLRPPLLPRPSVASIAAQISAVFEHLIFVRPRGAAPLMAEPDLDLATWQRACAGGREQALRGSHEELVEELQQCRQRIFHLDKELQRQARTMEVATERARLEHERTTARLLSVNQALESKLKQQTQEVRTCREQVSDFQRRVEHEQWRVEQKAKRAEHLEAELARFVRSNKRASI